MSQQTIMKTEPADYRSIPILHYVLLLLPLCAIACWAFWPLIPIVEAPISINLWVLVVLSALANIYILLYHYTTPAHPKFYMLRNRRIWLRVHIASGSVEFLAGIILLLYPGHTWPGLLMASAALFFHVPSSFAQNRIVAGSRALMIPTYIAGIGVHAFCALMLLLRPNSVFWAVNTFILFNTYAWVRIYGFLALKFNLFGPARYTVMVLGAGATTMTPVLGTLWPMQLALFLGVYLGWYKRFVARTPAEFEAFVRENSRWSGISKEASELWKKQDEETSQQQARNVFEFFDKDKRGYLNQEQLQALLSSWALPNEAVVAFVESLESDGTVTFDTFYKHVWSIRSVRERASLAANIQNLPSLRDKALFVFKMLDLNNNDSIQLFELKLLLQAWNLPPEDTEKYFALCDKDQDGRIEFEDFYHLMRPVWEYLFYNVLSLKVASENLVLTGELTTLKQDKQQSQKLLIQARKALVNKVPFLKNAPALFLQDLAEALQVEEYEPGDTIIEEWSRGDRFYILAKGQVLISRKGLHLSTLNEGASFGESALLFDTRRNASVRATTSVQILSITRASFASLVQQYPEMQQQLEEMAREESHQRIRNALQSILLLREGRMDKEAIDVVRSLTQRVHEVMVQTGESIVVEGEEGDSFYIIQSGKVLVHRGEQELDRFGSGDFFGEAALISGDVRNASVTALVDTALFCLNEEDFHNVLNQHPSFKQHILELHSLRSLHLSSTN